VIPPIDPDPRRAQGLLKALRFAKENLKDSLKDDNAHWHDTPYLTADATACDNFEADYGLPAGLDLHIPPEVAFPPPASDVGNEEVGCPSTGWPVPPSFGGVGSASGLSPMPSAGACEHGPDCPELIIRADHPVTPDAIEILEVAETYGSEAAARRGSQLSRNRQRRLQTSNRKRYAAIALERNLRLAAEKLAQQKLAAQQTLAMSTPKKPPVPAPDAFETEQTEAKITA
jgi:hypothetical protein